MSASSGTSPQTNEFDAVGQTLPSWKQEVSARLVAHRTRRVRPAGEQPTLPGMEGAGQPSRAARVAARVAERYSKAPTYSEMLAMEASNVARAAEAAANAAHEAQSAAEAMLAGLDLDREPDRTSREERSLDGDELQTLISAAPGSSRATSPPRTHYHIHPDSLPQTRHAPSRETQNRDAAPSRPRITESYPTAVDYPLEEALVAAAQPLPARLIEFPRELVATRKARPRLAEGPLRDAETGSEAGQLRIFEVESETISREAIFKEPVVDQMLPEWHSIQLDARPEADEGSQRPLGRQPGRNAGRKPSPEDAGRSAGTSDSKPYSSLLETVPLHLAPMEDRLMAGIVDAALVLTAFLLFVLVFAACTAHPPGGKPALIAAGALLVSFGALYQWLFFTYADGTPGMRYAKIALCTFDDENPTRQAMRGRVAALLLSALPLGLGFLWALLDDDRLTWHDRMTRTYQRSYR